MLTGVRCPCWPAKEAQHPWTLALLKRYAQLPTLPRVTTNVLTTTYSPHHLQSQWKTSPALSERSKRNLIWQMKLSPATATQKWAKETAAKAKIKIAHRAHLAAFLWQQVRVTAASSAASWPIVRSNYRDRGSPISAYVSSAFIYAA